MPTLGHTRTRVGVPRRTRQDPRRGSPKPASWPPPTSPPLPLHRPTLEEVEATPLEQWQVKMMRPRIVSTTRGGCPRRAMMVSATTDSGEVGERQRTAAAVGGGGSGATNSTSIDTVADNSASPSAPAVIGARWGGCIQPPAAALPLFIRGSRKSAHCALEHDMQGWRSPVDHCLLPSGILQQRIIDDMENFTHTTDANRNGLLHSFPVNFEAGASVLLQNSERSSLLPLFSRARANNVL